MTDIMTLRLKDRDKEALYFSSKQTGIPSSKLLYPFISEAIGINLGASILFNLDRNAPYQRARYERFIEMIKTGEGRVAASEQPENMEETPEATPRIVLDFFWMMREVKAAERLEQAMGEIQFVQDMGFLTPAFHRSLCLALADMYLSRGLSTSRLEADQARRAFFHIMISHYYRNNAKGTSKSLSTKWYSHQELVNKLVEEMVGKYEMRYPTKVVEAIEVREAIPVVPRKTVSKVPKPNPAQPAPAQAPPKTR
jgi:hypothetical protein